MCAAAHKLLDVRHVLQAALPRGGHIEEEAVRAVKAPVLQAQGQAREGLHADQIVGHLPPVPRTHHQPGAQSHTAQQALFLFPTHACTCAAAGSS